MSYWNTSTNDGTYYTFDNITPTTNTVAGFQFFSDGNSVEDVSGELTIPVECSGGIITSWRVNSDAYGSTTQAKIFIRRASDTALNVEGAGDRWMYSSGGVAWHTIMLTNPIHVFTGDRVRFSTLTGVPYQLYTSTVRSDLSNACVVAFDVQLPAYLGGFLGRYYDNNGTLSGLPTKTYVNATLNHTWAGGFPSDLSGMVSPQWCVAWTGYITFPASELVTLTTIANGGVRVFVNDTVVIDRWADDGKAYTDTGTINVGAGTGTNMVYPIRVEFVKATGSVASIVLQWASTSIGAATVVSSTAVTHYNPRIGTGLVGSYYQNALYPQGNSGAWTATPGYRDSSGNIYTDLSGGGGGLSGFFSNAIVTATRLDPIIDITWFAANTFGWSQTLPSPFNTTVGVPVNYFLVSWVGWLYVDFTETYTFTLLTDHGSILYVDTQHTYSPTQAQPNPTALIYSWFIQQQTLVSGSIRLEGGCYYPIRYDYFQYISDGGAAAKLYWQSQSLPRQIVPGGNLFPTHPVSGYGIRGTYYAGINFSGTAFPRIDANASSAGLNFTFDGTTTPLPGGLVTSDFSVVWSGYIRPDFSDVYTFTLTSQGSVRMAIDGVDVITHASSHPASDSTWVSYPFKAGRYYSIAIFYFNNAGTGIMRLQWSSTSVAMATVPGVALYADSPPSALSVVSFNTAISTGNGPFGQYYNYPAPTAGNPITSTGMSGATNMYFSASDVSGSIWPPAALTYPSGTRAGQHQKNFFSVVWSGYIMSQFTGSHVVLVTAAGYVRIYIRGVVVLNFSTSQASTNQSTPFALIRNTQTPVRIEYMGLDSDPCFLLFSWASTDMVANALPMAAVFDASGGLLADPPIVFSGRGNGLTGTYYPDYLRSPVTNNPPVSQIDPMIAFDWSHLNANGTVGPPGNNFMSSNFAVTWTGFVMVNYQEAVTFYYAARDTGDMFSNSGYVPFAFPTSNGMQYATMPIATGPWPFPNNTILRNQVFQPGGYAFLMWSSASIRWSMIPQTNLYTLDGLGNGLDIDFYSGTALFGTPIYNSIITGIDVTWTSPPIVPVGSDNITLTVPFSVIWLGFIQPTFEGIYKFYLTLGAIDRGRLIIGDVVVIDFQGNDLTGPKTGTIHMDAHSRHALRYEHIVLKTPSNDTSSTARLIWETVDASGNPTHDASGNPTGEPYGVVPEVCLFQYPYAQPMPNPTPPVPGNGNGIAARYYDGNTQDTLMATVVDSGVAVVWGTTAPHGLTPNDFNVLWTGFVQASCTGSMTFYVVTDGPATLTVTTASGDVGSMTGNAEGGMFWLTIASYTDSTDKILPITLTYRTGGVYAYAFLGWYSSTNGGQVLEPVTPSRLYTAVGDGVAAQYFSTPFPSASDMISRIDVSMNAMWDVSGPAPFVTPTPVPARFYGVVWQGYLRPVFSETYTFIMEGAGWSRVSIQGNNTHGEFVASGSATMDLSANYFYSFRVDFANNGLLVDSSGVSFRMSWVSTNQVLQPIPQAALFSTLSDVDLVGTSGIGPTPVPVVFANPSGYGIGVAIEYDMSGSNILDLSGEIVTFPTVLPHGMTPPAYSNVTGITWTGDIQPTYNETYTLRVMTNGGVVLTVGGVIVINDASMNHVAIYHGTYGGSAGIAVPIQLHYTAIHNDLNNSHVFLSWESATTHHTIVNVTRLFPQIGDGLRGRYTAARAPTSDGTATVTRIDPTINFNWNSTGPAPGAITTPYFYVIWTGWMRTNTTEQYTMTFTTGATALTRVIMDGVLYMEFSQGGTFPVDLIRGHFHSIRIEMLSMTAASSLSMQWESDTFTPAVVVPQYCLFSIQAGTGETSVDEVGWPTIGIPGIP